MPYRRRAQEQRVACRAYKAAQRKNAVSKSAPKPAQNRLKALINRNELSQAMDQLVQYDYFAEDFPGGHLLKLTGMNIDPVRHLSP